MTSEIFDLIYKAMEEQASIEADYQGYRRLMSPHSLGYKSGVEHCLLYQYGGGSKSGLGARGSGKNWRCLFIDQLSNVQIVPGTFETAPNHSRPNTCVDQVVAWVDANGFGAASS